MFSRATTQARRNSAISGVIEPKRIRSSTRSFSLENLRMVIVGPTSEMGGMTTLTREPSGRRASTIGRGLVDVAAERRDDAVDDAPHVVVVVELDVAQQQAALALEVDLLGAVDHDLGDGGVVAAAARWGRSR